MYDFDEYKDLSKFEKNFLSELLNDIDKRKDSIWAKSWNFIETQNAFSEHKYSGMNSFYLQLLARAERFEDPRFATFNQAKKNGYHIKKGSKGIPIQFFSFINKETKKQWNEAEFKEKTKNMTPLEKKKEADKKVAVTKTFHVFNAEKLISNKNKKTFSENNPITKFNKKINTNEMIDQFEKALVENMQVGFNERHSEGAFYTPTLDEVTMPLKEQFNSYEERMATLLHELGHATGHEERLNRELNTFFGSSKYGKEEFKVEMNSVFMINTLGLKISNKQKENHLRYLDSWGKTIKSQPKEFLYALNDSLKIKDYMLEKGKFKDVFLEKEINLENQKELITAFKNFTDYEYNQDHTKEEIINLIKDENYTLPIAYTVVEDDFDTFDYEKQVTYDFKNEELINKINNGYLSLTYNKKMTIEEITDNLSNASFDDFISQDNMGLDLEEVTDVMKLAVYKENEESIKNYADDNNLKLDFLDLKSSYVNKNHILKDINEDFFKNNNIDIPNNFIQDEEYKHLINFQLSHYEKVEDVSLSNNKRIIYNSDIDENKEHNPYSNYKNLWEENFKNDFIKDFEVLTINEIENNEDFNKNPTLINRLSNQNNEIKQALNQAKKYEKSIKDIDLDNDGVPDRIDIDDNRNAVQTVSDQFEVGNKTKKEKKVENNKKASRTR